MSPAELLTIAFLLAAAVSVDTLACGFGYGTSKTKVPFSHFTVINIIGSLCLGTALLVGYSVSRILMPEVTLVLSAAALLSVGIYKILQCFRRRKQQEVTSGRRTSWAETFTISFVLSIDSIAVGLGAAVYNASIIFCLTAVVFSLLTDTVLFWAGYRAGAKLADRKTTLDLSWVSGVVLIAVAFTKIFL